MRLTHGVAATSSLQVLVFAPQGRDARLISDVLCQAGMQAEISGSLDELLRHLPFAGAAVIAEEAMDGRMDDLRAALAAQEPWSDIPLVILSQHDRRDRADGQVLDNASILPRPLAPLSLVSVVRVALRARRRQYQLKAHLEMQHQRASDVLAGIFDGYLAMDWQWRCTYVNPRGAAFFGHVPEDFIGLDMHRVLPHWLEGDFKAQVQYVVETGEPFATEKRCPITKLWFNVRCSRSVDGVSFFYSDITPRVEADAERARYERRLQEARDQLALALSSTQTGLWDWDVISGELKWSSECRAIFGVAPDQPMDYETYLACMHPDDRETADRLVLRSLDPKIRDRFDHQYRVVRRSGEIRWVLARGTVYFEADTPVRFIGTVVDITEEKAAEEHLRLLVDELSHRVKNTLAVIQTIADQSFKSGGAATDIHRAFIGRLQALAETHSLLTVSHWESVDLAELIARSLGHMSSGAGSRMDAGGEHVSLTPKASLAIGMTLHELSTNAAKYGALAAEQGWVEIRWRIAGDSLLIHWCEKGAHDVRPPSRKGFGSKLIKQAIEYDLAGELEVDYRPTGLHCRMTVPARGVLAV